MTTTEIGNPQTKSHAPEILELLSELEKRDKASKGATQSGSAVGAGVNDPRGFAVINTTNHDVGKVADLYVDPHTRQAHFALLALGNHTLGIGDRSVLVAFSDIVISGDKQVKIRVAVS